MRSFEKALRDIERRQADEFWMSTSCTSCFAYYQPCDPECDGEVEDFEDPCPCRETCRQETGDREDCYGNFGDICINDRRCKVCQLRADCSAGQVPEGWPECETPCSECPWQCNSRGVVA